MVGGGASAWRSSSSWSLSSRLRVLAILLACLALFSFIASQLRTPSVKQEGAGVNNVAVSTPCPPIPKLPPPSMPITCPSCMNSFVTCESEAGMRNTDTRTFDISPQLLSNWSKGEYPHQRHFDPQCPKWLWSSVVLRFGFGHKTGNWVTGLIGAQILRLRSVYNVRPNLQPPMR
jgi:hypothetical protein